MMYRLYIATQNQIEMVEVGSANYAQILLRKKFKGVHTRFHRTKLNGGILWESDLTMENKVIAHATIIALHCI